MPAQTPNSSVQFPKTCLSDGTFVIGTPGDPVYVVVEGGGGSGTLPTSDAADAVIGAPIGADVIVIGGENPTGNAEPFQLDANSELITSSIGLALHSTNQVSISASATQIIGANAARAGVVITNPGTILTVYIGNAGVTAANGFPLAPGNSITLPVVGAVYGITSSSIQTVGYLEVQ